MTADPQRRLVVVGAGIAGLTIAHALTGTCDVHVFERETYPGGKIHSEHIDGFLFEWGPNAFLSSVPELRDLIAKLDLEKEIVEASPLAAHRFVYWKGRLHRLPAEPPELLRMSLLTPLGKARALGDLVTRSSSKNGELDESVFAFVERRFGREAAERLVAPALLGITGGDARKTSVDALFPRLRVLETSAGSVVRGMIRERRARGALSSFGGAGMQRLIQRLAERLGDRLHLGAAVVGIAREKSGWRVSHEDGEVVADDLVLASPAFDAAALIVPFDPLLASELEAIPYAAMRPIGIAFRREDLPSPLDGFGFLAARGMGVRILGALYTSTIFPNQAPSDVAYLRVFLGGALDPQALHLDEREGRAIVRNDLRTTLGITAEPIAYHEKRWQRAIPQYGLDHRSRLRRIDDRLASHPGLWLAGNAYRGIGLGDGVRDATALAEALASRRFSI